MKLGRSTYNLSIRTQLLAWLVIPMLVLLIVGGFITYGLSVSLATDAYDKALLDNAYSIAGCVQMRNDQIVVDIPPAALAILKDNVKDRVLYQVLDEHHRVIAGDANLPLPDFEARDTDDSKSADYRDATIGGEPVRIATVKFPFPSQPKSKQGLYIQVGETLHAREQIADEILTGVVLQVLPMVFFSALVVYFGVKRGLAPLNNLRDAVASRSPVDLGPIAAEDVPKEVRPLVLAINELLEKLKDDIEAQRRFVANAAHQLRTPIAGLKMQSELALRQKEPGDVQHALGLIQTAAERAARLANQLLALARSEPGAVDQSLWQVIDINEVAKEATKEFVPAAISRNIDLGFEQNDAQALVRGDRASLHELAANLIDNAVRYTPEGGAVTVRIEAHRDQNALLTAAALVVEDNGPGIPEEEREHVFERFYRLLDRNGSGSGSGLGLAIVREIANVHQANVRISEGSNGQGARIQIVFPPAGALLSRTAAAAAAASSPSLLATASSSE